MNYQYEQATSSQLNEFTDDEIREQLELLGFKNVSKDKFNQFKNDLEKLIAQEVSINNSNTSYSEYYQAKMTTSIAEDRTSPVHVLNHRHQHSHQEYPNDKFYKNKKVTFPDDSHLIDGRYDENKEEAYDSDQSFASIVTTSSVVDNKVLKRKVIR